MLHYLCSLAPVQTGPWWSGRHYVYERMRQLAVRPGDIVCRLGNGYVYGYFWLSKFIANVTGSKYSHAAMVINADDDILLADVDTNGLRRQYLADWCNDIRGDDILLLRFTGNPAISQIAVENAKVILSPTCHKELLNNDDGRNFYCVELVCWCYLRAGVLLCDEVPIKDLPGWTRWMTTFASFHGVDVNKPVWCVGNKVGLLSSKYLTQVGRIECRSRPTKLISPIFNGA